MTSKIRIALAAAMLALASVSPGGLIVAPAQAGLTATGVE